MCGFLWLMEGGRNSASLRPAILLEDRTFRYFIICTIIMPETHDH
jgi:hypothetical protein